MTVADSTGNVDHRSGPRHIAIVVAGVVLCQVVLLGPSLLGQKVLLPLDLLALSNVYLPRTDAYAQVVPQDRVLSDQIFGIEIDRQFAAREFRAGRLPLWNPYLYCGVPSASWPKYSPYNLLYCLCPDPRALAWLHLLQSVVAGLGAYFFFRHVLPVSFWPAALGGWCFPLTGFFTHWQGFPGSYTVALLPWVLLLTDRAVRSPRGWSGPGLAVMTGLTLISGQVDLAGLVLLTSGLYALWCLFDQYVSRPDVADRVSLIMRRGFVAVGAWGLGFLLAAPYLLPIVDYSATGSRMKAREKGVKERPPVGLASLPLVLLPEYHGTTARGSVFLLSQAGNLLESSAVGYAGLLAAGLLAPWAWLARRRRLTLFWLILVFVGLSWCLDVPGLVWLWRRPGLNMLSYNRMAFASAFGLLCLAVTGLDVLRQEKREVSVGFRWVKVALVLLAGWCLYRSANLPEPVAGQIRQSGLPVRQVEEIQHGFSRTYLAGAALCGLALAGWWWTGSRKWRPKRSALLGLMLVGELLWTAWGKPPQQDRSLYYPRLPLLETLQSQSTGRILGYACFPSNLNMIFELPDIRGYDGVDPQQYLELLSRAEDRATAERFGRPPYATVQWFIPRLMKTDAGDMKLPPILNMLGVRHVVFRGKPESFATHQYDDYWAWENSGALSRVFVPRNVVPMTDNTGVLARVSQDDFDPVQTAFVLGATDRLEDCRGTAKIVAEVPTEVTVAVTMDTPGVVVLADRWDQDWRAYLEGEPRPIHPTNFALRGVDVPAGSRTLVFRYEPRSFARGVRLLLLAIGGVLAWSACEWWRGRKRVTPVAGTP